MTKYSEHELTGDGDETVQANPWPASRFTEAERAVLHDLALAGFRVLDARKDHASCEEQSGLGPYSG